jgi:hypothetical protein
VKVSLCIGILPYCALNFFPPNVPGYTPIDFNLKVHSPDVCGSHSILLAGCCGRRARPGSSVWVGTLSEATIATSLLYFNNNVRKGSTPH